MSTSSRDSDGMSLEEATARAAVAQWLTGEARDGMAAAKKEILRGLLGPGDRVHARIQGMDVGTVSVTAPKARETIVVTDEAAFTSWVAEHHQDAIQTVVAPWFREPRTLSALINATGEVPPGVDVTQQEGRPTVQVRLSDEQRRNLTHLSVTATLPSLTGSTRQEGQQ